MARVQRTFKYENVQLVVIQDGVQCWVTSTEGEPWAVLSVQTPYLPEPPRGFFWLKTWSENKNITANMFAKGILKEVELMVTDDHTTGLSLPVSQWVAVIAAKVVPNAAV
jgi:hypothetical protein